MQRSLTLENLTWIDLEDPNSETMLALKDEHGFHELDIEDCLSENQRSKVDEYTDYLFTILHIPFYDKLEKIWSNLENLKELIESLQDTNESIISHTTNNVIKTLTIFSVLMLPLNLLVGIYGMNVHLPLSANPLIFYLLAGGMAAILLIMLLVFKLKHWL